MEEKSSEGFILSVSLSVSVSLSLCLSLSLSNTHTPYNNSDIGSCMKRQLVLGEEFVCLGGTGKTSLGQKALN